MSQVAACCAPGAGRHSDFSMRGVAWLRVWARALSLMENKMETTVMGYIAIIWRNMKDVAKDCKDRYGGVVSQSQISQHLHEK